MKLWIARDYRGLYMFENQPHLVIDIFHSYKGFILSIQDDKFPEVTFENSPQMVELPEVTFENSPQMVELKLFKK